LSFRERFERDAFNASVLSFVQRIEAASAAD